MRSGSVLSTRARIDDAVDEAADRLEAGLERAPDVLFVFASTRLRGDLSVVPARASARLSSPLVCGCTSEGVLAEGRERERLPALAMLGVVLPEGARAHPLRVEAGSRRIPIGSRPTGAVLLPDPFSADVEALLRRFDATFPGVPLVGGLPSGARRPGEHKLFLEGWTFGDGAVGIALGGRIRMESLVAQSARPIGEPMIVTRVDGPRILELDRGRPADVLRELMAALGPDDRRRLRERPLCGVQMRDTQLEYGPGDFLVRDVLRVEPESGAIVVATRLEGYPVVQLHVLDPTTATRDLESALRRQPDEPPLGALMFSGTGRGLALHGAPDHDSRIVAERFGGAAIGGFFSDGEIAPVGDITYLHYRTSAVALLRATPRRARERRGPGRIAPRATADEAPSADEPLSHGSSGREAREPGSAQGR